MGRRNRRERQPEPAQPRVPGLRRVESHADGDWLVTQITGANAKKVYRCPGCDMEIPIGTAHIVAWQDYLGGAQAEVEHRRHWHTACWKRRTGSARY